MLSFTNFIVYKSNEFFDLLLDEGNKFKPHLEFKIEKRLYSFGAVLHLFEHYYQLLLNDVSEEIIKSFFK